MNDQPRTQEKGPDRMLFGLLGCVVSAVIRQLHGCVKASIGFECIRQCQGFGFWFVSLFFVLRGGGGGWDFWFL